MFILYLHHDIMMWVKKKLKGKHRKYCLCFQGCRFFKPDKRKENCKVANNLYKFDIKNSVTTPVWECRNFSYKKKIWYSPSPCCGFPGILLKINKFTVKILYRDDSGVCSTRKLWNYEYNCFCGDRD